MTYQLLQDARESTLLGARATNVLAAQERLAKAAVELSKATADYESRLAEYQTYGGLRYSPIPSPVSPGYFAVADTLNQVYFEVAGWSQQDAARVAASFNDERRLRATDASERWIPIGLRFQEPAALVGHGR